MPEVQGEAARSARPPQRIGLPGRATSISGSAGTGAIDRFKALLKEDPEYTGRDAVYFHLAESLAKDASGKPRRFPISRRLVEEFEQSEYLARRSKRIAELKTRS